MNMDGQDEQDFGVRSATTVQNALGQALPQLFFLPTGEKVAEGRMRVIGRIDWLCALAGFWANRFHPHPALSLEGEGIEVVLRLARRLLWGLAKRLCVVVGLA